MPYIIRWTPYAIECIDSIYLFLEKKDKAVATKAAQCIFNKLKLLSQFPNIGTATNDLDPEHREIVIPFGSSGYIVLYEIREDTILVLSVRHQKETGY